jgi:hypothetical protein
MAWMDKLESYKTDLSAAQKEIQRAKSVYDTEKAAGAEKSRLDQISLWADQVRNASGISNDNAQYGNNPNTYQQPANTGGGGGGGGFVTSPGTANANGTITGGINMGNLSGMTPGMAYDPAPANQQGSGSSWQANPDGGWEQVQDQPEEQLSVTDALLQQFMMMQGANSAQMQEMQAMAQAQAARSAGERRDAFGNLIDTLGDNQTSELEGLNSRLAGSKQDLEDRTFQDYLQARQAMANRGLAGSGLASDQDTRLLLSQGRDLARINQSGMADANEIQRRYGNKLTEAQQQLAGISQTDIEAQLFQQLMESGNKSMNDRAGSLIDLIGKTIGYDRISQKDAADVGFKYDELATKDRQFYDELDSKEQQAYAKLGAEERQWMAELTSKHSLEMSKIMGVDQNGNPTLDAFKLQEEIRSNKAREYEQNRHNGVSESQGWARVTQSKNELDHKINTLTAEAEKFKANITNTQLKQQASALQGIVTEEGRNLRDLRGSLEGMDEGSTGYQSTLDQYNNSKFQYESAIQAMEDLMELDRPGTSSSSSTNIEKYFNGSTNTIPSLGGTPLG